MISAPAAVHVTVELLDAAAVLEQPSAWRVCRLMQTRVVRRLGGLLQKRSRPEFCPDEPAALMDVSCPEHGSRRLAVCRKHLDMIRAGLTTLCGGACRRSVEIRDSGL
jgi:hypothetical protein